VHLGEFSRLGQDREEPKQPPQNQKVDSREGLDGDPVVPQPRLAVGGGRQCRHKYGEQVKRQRWLREFSQICLHHSGYRVRINDLSQIRVLSWKTKKNQKVKQKQTKKKTKKQTN